KREYAMLCRILFICAFWGGAYMLRQQSNAYFQAYEIAEAKEKFTVKGKWLSTHGDGSMLEFRKGKFTLSRENRNLRWGVYSDYDGMLTISREYQPRSSDNDSPAFPGGTIACTVSDSELILFEGQRFVHEAMRWMGIPPENRNGPLRFRRVQE